jgi:hypothetical protein
MHSLQAKLKNISKSYESNKLVRAGFLGGSRYPEAEGGTPVALVAAVHEFGAPAQGIPPRPFMSKAIARNKDKWAKKASDLIAEVGVDKALDQVGEEMADDIRKSIRDEDWTPLNPATVKRKGFEKPLINTKHMLDTVTHEVTEK